MKNRVGKIEIDCGNIIATDTCYGYLNNHVFKTRSGLYNVYISSIDDDIKYMEIVHTLTDKVFNNVWNDTEIACNIESGTFGFFDYNYFKSNHTENSVTDVWYDTLICNGENSGNTDNKGFWCETNQTKVTYKIYAIYSNENKNEICGLKIIFTS